MNTVGIKKEDISYTKGRDKVRIRTKLPKKINYIQTVSVLQTPWHFICLS
jgi:hypothetical protein